MRIRSRAYLLGLVPVLLVATVLTGYLVIHRIGEMEDTLRDRGAALSRYVAQGVEYAVVSGNLPQLRELLAWTLNERDVVYAAVLEPGGQVLAEAGKFMAHPRPSLKAGITQTPGEIVFCVPVVLASLDVEDVFLQGNAEAKSRPIAWVRLVLSQAGNRAVVRDMLMTTLAIVIMGVMVAALLVRTLAVIGIKPLMEILDAVRAISAGNFRVRLPLTARSELRELQQGINQMSEALQSFQEDMQHQVDEATAGLVEQKNAAEQANQSKSKFLAAASHDLRQPMHAISLYVEALKPRLQGREAAATLEKIDAAVVAMEGLFNSILDVSKLDAGVVVPEMSPVSVKSLLHGLYEDFQYEAAKKGIRLRMRCGSGLVLTDPVLLGRILRNLVSNAIRYTDRGGVLLTARRRGEVFRFQVWDTGRGIAKEHLPQVFQEFFQVGNPHRDRSQGLGLGLAIVDRLAKLLGYPLTVRSMPGAGTIISVDVPMLRAQVENVSDKEATLVDMTLLRGRVAVVDDDAMVRDSLAGLLREWGLEVWAASDQAELLAEIKTAPDVLITDYRLGEGDGLALADALARALPLASCQEIVITRDTSPAGVRALEASGYPVLHKPVRPARLRALLTRLLKVSRG